MRSMFLPAAQLFVIVIESVLQRGVGNLIRELLVNAPKRSKSVSLADATTKSTLIDLRLLTQSNLTNLGGATIHLDQTTN